MNKKGLFLVSAFVLIFAITLSVVIYYIHQPVPQSKCKIDYQTQLEIARFNFLNTFYQKYDSTKANFAFASQYYNCTK